MSKILISTSGPQLFRAEEEMVFIHHKPIQCFGNYRIPSGEKTGRRRCPDRGCEECQVAPDEHSGCHSKGGLFLQLDTPLLISGGQCHSRYCDWYQGIVLTLTDIFKMTLSVGSGRATNKWVTYTNGHSLSTPRDASAFKYRVLFDTWTNWAMKSESLCTLFMNGLPCLSIQEAHCCFLLWTTESNGFASLTALGTRNFLLLNWFCVVK